jgi:transcriptional antiterminator RfaH
MHSEMNQKNNLIWYVLVIRSRHEKKCEQLLTKKGIEVFLPLQKVIREWSDRKKKIDVPLFSGYLFIKYDTSKRIEILNTPGVVRFIRYDQQDATVPESQIQAIKSALCNSVLIDVVDQHFSEGEEILIKSGPFEGLYGKIVFYNSKRKIQISIDAIGKNLLIEIGKTRIEKIRKKE